MNRFVLSLIFALLLFCSCEKTMIDPPTPSQQPSDNWNLMQYSCFCYGLHELKIGDVMWDFDTIKNVVNITNNHPGRPGTFVETGSYDYRILDTTFVRYNHQTQQEENYVRQALFFNKTTLFHYDEDSTSIRLYDEGSLNIADDELMLLLTR
ncbi:MAG: hypothetical protein ACI9UJ_001967 [bacterium]|jgi:hypothetical protein